MLSRGLPTTQAIARHAYRSPLWAGGRRHLAPAGFQQPLRNRLRATAAGRLSCRLAVAFGLLVALLGLGACGPLETNAPVQGEQSGGGSSPERVATNFFEDLRSALKDPQLANDEKRSSWVEQLSGYFAPGERPDIRVALSASLETLASGQAELAANEDITLDLRFDGIELVESNGNQARVRPVNGTIDVLITRTTDTGEAYTLFEQSKSLNEIIGSPDGVLPAVRIGSTWYLSEG